MKIMKRTLWVILVITSTLKAQFFWSNPTVQNNTLRSVALYNNSVLFAVGELGTVLTSTDFGKNWKVTHRFLGLENDLYSIDFTDENNGWICGTYGLIIRNF